MPQNLGLLSSDQNGKLLFDEINFNTLNSNFVKSNYYNQIINRNVNSITNNIGEILNNLILQQNRDKISYGFPINYFLPMMTFNSDRGSISSDNSTTVFYSNFDAREYSLFKSYINYVNEKNFLHTINYNSRYLLSYGSIETILTNYMDSIFASRNKIFYNQLANEYYLRVLNLATIAKQNYSYYTTEGSNNLFYTLNKNLFNFIADISENSLLSEFQFNEIPNFLDQCTNPPYYFDLSGSDAVKVNLNMTISGDDNNKDVSINKLLVYGDIEYEQNFFTIKNIVERPQSNDASTNIILYFYAQNTNNKDTLFDDIFDMCANSLDISNAFTIANNLPSDSSYIIRDLINDFSDICLYDYGNIMFALDNSFTNYININESSFNHILIPPLKQLTEIQKIIYNNNIFFDSESVVNISNTMINLFNIDISHDNIEVNIDNNSKTKINENYYVKNRFGYSEETKKVYYNYLRTGQIKDLNFIECMSNNLSINSLSNITNDISNNTSNNILILCPVIEENYILKTQANTDRTIEIADALDDASFNFSVYRYLPLITYFNNLANDNSLNLNLVISTNQTDTINKLLVSFESGFSNIGSDNLKKHPRKSIIVDGNFNKSRIFLTKYNTINKLYKDIGSFSDNYSINFITSGTLNVGAGSQRVLDEIIYLYNLNLIDNQDNNINTINIHTTDIFSNYIALENSLYSYALTLLYSNSDKFNNNLINLINQIDTDNLNYTIFDYYKDIIQNTFLPQDTSSISLINDILNGRVIKNTSIKKFINTNFSFFELTDNDIQTSYGYNIDTLKQYSIWNYKISILFLLLNYDKTTGTSKNLNNLNITDPSFTNFTINQISILQVDGINTDEITDDSIIYYNPTTERDINNLSGNNRFELLKLWKQTYSSPFQYLTINTGD